MKSFRHTLLVGIVGLAIMGLASIAHSAETGWKYRRSVSEFSDDVTHYVTSYDENGKGWIRLICIGGEILKIELLAPPGPVSLFFDLATVYFRVDKKPMHTFQAGWERGVVYFFWDNKEEVRRLIRDLMRGTKLIYKVSESDTATILVTGSAEPINKVLKACNISL